MHNHQQSSFDSNLLDMVTVSNQNVAGGKIISAFLSVFCAVVLLN